MYMYIYVYIYTHIYTHTHIYIYIKRTHTKSIPTLRKKRTEYKQYKKNTKTQTHQISINHQEIKSGILKENKTATQTKKNKNTKYQTKNNKN